MTLHWVPITGSISQPDANTLHFSGKPYTYADPTTNEPRIGGEVGQAFCDARFSGGKIRCTIRFESLHERSAAGITIAANPVTGAHLTAMMGLGPFCALRAWPGTPQFGNPMARWIDYQLVGNQTNIKAGQDYQVEVEVHGSRIAMLVDGVQLIDADIRETLPRFKPGVWFLSEGHITVRNFEIASRAPNAFVVMEFSQHFDDLYEHVIRPTCTKLQISAIRADERHGPGLIIADIERQIVESQVVIADVTPVNANVFYEVGYAHALRKPTVLLAQKGTRLPFDISGFRTIFYSNTIDGKIKVEEGLEKHLNEIIQPQGA